MAPPPLLMARPLVEELYIAASLKKYCRYPSKMNLLPFNKAQINNASTLSGNRNIMGNYEEDCSCTIGFIETGQYFSYLYLSILYKAGRLGYRFPELLCNCVSRRAGCIYMKRKI